MKQRKKRNKYLNNNDCEYSKSNVRLLTLIVSEIPNRLIVTNKEKTTFRHKIFKLWEIKDKKQILKKPLKSQKKQTPYI